MRFSYLVFVPAWMLLGYSLYMGMAAQGNVLALLNLKNVNEPVTKLELNNNLSCQISYMKAGLVILGIWFAVYFSWWVITQAPNQRDSNV